MNSTNQPKPELVGDYCSDLDQQTFNYYDIISSMIEYFRLFNKHYIDFNESYQKKRTAKNKYLLLQKLRFMKENYDLIHNLIYIDMAELLVYIDNKNIDINEIIQNIINSYNYTNYHFYEEYGGIRYGKFCLSIIHKLNQNWDFYEDYDDIVKDYYICKGFCNGFNINI